MNYDENKTKETKIKRVLIKIYLIWLTELSALESIKILTLGPHDSRLNENHVHNSHVYYYNNNNNDSGKNKNNSNRHF